MSITRDKSDLYLVLALSILQLKYINKYLKLLVKMEVKTIYFSAVLVSLLRLYFRFLQK